MREDNTPQEPISALRRVVCEKGEYAGYDDAIARVEALRNAIMVKVLYPTRHAHFWSQKMGMNLAILMLPIYGVPENDLIGIHDYK
jgi:hypothetical protein